MRFDIQESSGAKLTEATIHDRTSLGTAFMDTEIIHARNCAASSLRVKDVNSKPWDSG